MYAAAGGASLASRQARQRQRQQNNKNKALLQQAKLAQPKSGGTVTPTRNPQSRQFHQLPSTYLRTPQAQARKLSASYATQSKLLLPICESNNQQQRQHLQNSHSHHHHQLHQHHQQQQHYHQHQHHFSRPLSSKLLHSQQHLIKSATATLPLVSQAEDTPPATPTISFNASSRPPIGDFKPNDSQNLHLQHLQFAQDSIIVTPATPHASPSHHATTQPFDGTVTTVQLERKCSFYRVPRSDTFDDGNYATTPTSLPPGATITAQQIQQQLDAYTEESNLMYGLPNGGGGQKWAYCEQELCICDQIECAQGRAAWLERGRRCSVQDSNPASCHRRWVKRNRIQDSSLGGSSDDEDFLGVLRGPSSFANAFLYVGLGTIAIGLVIAFVGTGEKGFKTVELRLIGPSLIGIGLICCILRICFCICPSHCISSSKRARKKNVNKIDADHTTSLLRNESKRVSIAKGPHLQRFPLTHKSKSNNKMLNEGIEALRQLATTSLLLQNEQKPTNRVVPIIKEPQNQIDAPIEMKKLDTALDMRGISDDEADNDEAASNYNNQIQSLVQSQSKLGRQRIPTNHQEQHKSKDSDLVHMETSLIIINSTSSQPSLLQLPIPQSKEESLPTTKDIEQTSCYQIQHSLTSGFSVSHSETLQPPLVITTAITQSPISCNRLMPASSLVISSTSSADQDFRPSVPSSPLLTTIFEPELVLSPAKLGQ